MATRTAELRAALVAEFGDQAKSTRTAKLLGRKDVKPAEIREAFLAEFGDRATQTQSGRLLGFTQEAS